MAEFRQGELFAYVRDHDEGLEAIELGQVKRKVDDETYACYYSTGDTAARTNVRNMRKFANSGWSHVEKATALMRDLWTAAGPLVAEEDYFLACALGDRLREFGIGDET